MAMKSADNTGGPARASLKVATAQYPIDKPTDLTAWQRKLEDWVARGARTGAELLVFPEYGAIEQAAAFGPDVYANLAETLRTVAEQAGERVAFHCELAKRFGVHILVGSGPVCSDDGQVHNSAQLVTPDGLIGEQQKLIMTPFEVDWGISPGQNVYAFDTDLGRIGIAICYDSEFPLIAHAMASAGVELVLVPSCTERVSGFHRVRAGAQARALENQIACVVSHTIGDATWSPAVDFNNGAAGLYVPPEQSISETGVIAQGKLNEPGWTTGTIDLSALRTLRTSGEMRNFSDWRRQPGATLESAPVGLQDLRGQQSK